MIKAENTKTHVRLSAFKVHSAFPVNNILGMLRNSLKYNSILNSLKHARSISSQGSKLLKPSLELPDKINDRITDYIPAATDSYRSSKETQYFNSLNVTQVNKNESFAAFRGSYAAASNHMSRTRDVMQLWSLLEACLLSKYFKRARSILASLYDIKSHRELFIDDYNLYLQALSKIDGKEKLTLTQLTSEMQKDLTDHFSGIKYNSKTIAILIHHALKDFESDQQTSDHDTLIHNIRTILRMSDRNQKELFQHVDVLTVADYKILYQNLGLIKDYLIPQSLRPLIIENSHDISATDTNTRGDKVLVPATEATKEANANAINEAPHDKTPILEIEDTELSSKHQNLLDINVEDTILEKDAQKLKPVNTIGMKVVRHALQGLCISDKQKQKLLDLENNFESNLLNLDDNSINFFELYKSLKTDEERERFEGILNDLNQERQLVLERRATDISKERWRYEFEQSKARGDLSIQRNLNAKLWDWYRLMLPLIKEEVKICNNLLNDSKHSKSTKMSYAPYMILVSPEKLAVITILEILKLNSTGGVIEGMRTARAVIAVGKAIEMEFRSDQLLSNESNAFKEINKNSPMLKNFVRHAKSTFRALKIEQSKIVWPQTVRAKLGSVLISMLIQVARVDVSGYDPIMKKEVHGDAPAFTHTYQYQNGSKLGVLKIHKSLINQLNGERMVASVQPQLLPMLVKPRPWYSWKSGGYFYTQSSLIRTKDSPEQLAYLKAVSDGNAIKQVYDGLNVLGNTAWTVNGRVLAIMSEMWNTGKEFLDIPRLAEELELIPAPPRNSDPSVIRNWKLENKRIANKFSADRSMRCSTNYKLEIARAFLGEKFYFPHNLDFRGRAYPLSPHFNHLGNDMSRGLLIFWKGKRLGARGLRWLKVHLANLYGYDKASLNERIEFVENHVDDIRRSAMDPLSPNAWWKDAEKPWQTLATCMELEEAWKLENPEDYISHQPVHQDGTCNGLQHYAALGGDVEGATQVNLIPADRPQDVYAHVANLVEQRLEVAAAAGEEHAIELKGKISRKVVKQTVMTNVYGVTYVGATFQIAKQLSDLFDDRQHYLILARYLTKHVFEAIRELFLGAHLIQDWLGESAKRISKSIRLDVDEESFKNGDKPDFMSSVIWTTPLGLPIVQPYRDASKRQITTNLQTIFISDPFAVNPINARRQKAGFPPNYIHSLDASHMLLSASQCGAKGLDFASVHDSYWTHACDVDQMNVLLREEFINLHEVDLIKRLKEEFNERYQNHLQVIKIAKNSKLAQKVIKAREELSRVLGRQSTIADEIYIEKQRRQQQNSLDNERSDGSFSPKTTIQVAMEAMEDNPELESVKAANNEAHLLILVPLRLPDIPKKGDFDVTTLRNSKYFFS